MSNAGGITIAEFFMYDSDDITGNEVYYEMNSGTIEIMRDNDDNYNIKASLKDSTNADYSLEFNGTLRYNYE
jgi:hypothetical protein